MNDSIASLFSYASAWLRLLKDHVHLVFLEAKLAKSSFIPFLSCGLILLALAFSTWLSLLTIAGYFIYYLTAKLIFSLCAVLFLNIIFMIITALFMYRYYKDVTFQKSRENWKSIEQLQLNLPLEDTHEQKDLAKKN